MKSMGRKDKRMESSESMENMESMESMGEPVLIGIAEGWRLLARQQARRGQGVGN